MRLDVNWGGALRLGRVGLCCVATLGSGAAVAQEQAAGPDGVEVSDTFFGNVRASDIFSLSYGVGGCIVELSEPAKRDRVVQKGQVVIKMDDLREQLALRTAEARVSDLAAAIEERQLTLDAALANDRRLKQDLDLVEEEFERNSVLAGRGLINESTMDTIERRFMEATFASERAKETISNSEAAIKRAEIALEIGQLEKQTAEIDLAKLQVVAPFDGVLVGFDPNVGDCVQEGGLAARVYEPDQKSVDVFFRISRLTEGGGGELAIGAPVRIDRVNGQGCNGAITLIGTEADLESQFVQATVEVEESCATQLFLNEAVEVHTLKPGN